MNKGTVEQLAQLQGNPAVSILCPLDSRRPGNPHDPAVLADLRDRAAEQVHAKVSEHAASAMVARVDDALAALDLEHPTPGVAIYVSADVTRVIPLESPVEPEVVVGDRFAIRGLLGALHRTRRARVIVLSQARTRCIDVTGGNAYERLDFGFPIETRPPLEADTPRRDFPLDEHEHAEAAKFVFREVERALDALQHHDARPLVLLGVERDLAYFAEITAHGASVVSKVHGDYEWETPDAIADLARPALDTQQREQDQHACAEAREAIGSRAVAGIVDTWTAARAGRGHRLVVEEEYRYPAHAPGGTLEPAGIDDPGAFDAVEDTVEEVVRHGGEVVVVHRDGLADVGRIALVTRY